MSYQQLKLEERHYIEVENKAGTPKKDIAMALGRSPSTISRELSRNKGKRSYHHKQANRKALERHQEKHKVVKLTDEIKALIAKYLKQGWSPEQIAGRLKLDGVISLHHETIYQFVLTDKKSGGDLYTYLRHQAKTYRKRYGSAHNRTGIPNRVDIDERPQEVEDRSRVGDWEADTIIGKGHQGAIVTMDERRSKLRLAAPLEGKKADCVAAAMKKLLAPIKEHVLTITFDNGKEFTRHEEVAKDIDCKTYFAKPYHSWERGQNENANGLLRQYFPKHMSLLGVDARAVVEAVHKLNERPKKCLGFKTPYEVFKELTGVWVKPLYEIALMT